MEELAGSVPVASALSWIITLICVVLTGASSLLVALVTFWLKRIADDLAKVREDARRDRDQLQARIDAVAAKADNSVRRVHGRVDGLQQSYMPQAQCAMQMDAAREWYKEASAKLSSEIAEIRTMIADFLKALGGGQKQ